MWDWSTPRAWSQSSYLKANASDARGLLRFISGRADAPLLIGGAIATALTGREYGERSATARARAAQPAHTDTAA